MKLEYRQYGTRDRSQLCAKHHFRIQRQTSQIRCLSAFLEEKETEIKRANEKVSEEKATIKIKQVGVIVTGD